MNFEISSWDSLWMYRWWFGKWYKC